MINYRKLIVWQLGMELVKEVYLLTRTLPSEEKFGLCDQIRRAAVSIPSNIAEGHARDSQKEFHHFLQIASGSLAELETHLLICKELGYSSEERIAPLLKKTNMLRRKLSALRKTLTLSK
jgi:four helix bundle protein